MFVLALMAPTALAGATTADAPASSEVLNTETPSTAITVYACAYGAGIGACVVVGTGP